MDGDRHWLLPHVGNIVTGSTDNWCFIRGDAVKPLKKRDPQSKEITTWTEFEVGAVPQIRRDIPFGADIGGDPGGRGHPEINEHRMILGTEQDVVWFDVIVEQGRRVAVHRAAVKLANGLKQGLSDLNKSFDGRKLIRLDFLAQRWAFDQIHCEEEALAPPVTQRFHAFGVGRIDGLRGPQFGPGTILRNVGVEDFQGHTFLLRAADGAVDLGMTATGV